MIKSTPARRAAKRDRAAQIGKIEQAVIKTRRAVVDETIGVYGEAKELFTSKANMGQVLLIALAATAMVASGFVDGVGDMIVGRL